MKVALVNNNPAVSRLATLSLSKIGCEYIEVSSLDMLDSGLFDVLIIDSDVCINATNLKDFADKILYLASKNSPEFKDADRILFKPFLPTEFVSIMEKLSPKEEEPNEDDEFSDMQDVVNPLEESEFIDDLDSEIFDSNLPEIDEFKDDDFAIDDTDLVDEGDENAFDELKIQENDLTQELSELVKSIDDMAEDASDEAANEIDEAVDTQMLSREEELLKEFGFSDEALEQDDDETKSQADFGKFDELMSELASPAYDEELDVIESIKSDIDEIENLGSEFEKEPQEDAKGFIIQEDVKDEFVKEDAENLAQEIKSADELGDEKFDIKSQAQFEIKEQDLQSDVKDEDSASKLESVDFKIYESGARSYEDIDQISEDDIKRALKEDFDEVILKENSVDIKSELTDKISEQIATSLSVSSIKDALKGMNIKINITFEEK